MSEKAPNSLLIEPHYLPSISWILKVASYDTVYLDVSSNYVKASYRNRCKVLSPNGVLTLSVPLSKATGNRDTMKTVKISFEENWQKIHWMTLMSCYRRSPYFEFFEDTLAPYYQKKYDLLIDLNYDLLKLLFKICKVRTEIRFTDHYIEPGMEGFDDLRNVITPKWVNPLKMELPRYPQVFSDRFDFFSDLSMIDLIFNDGKINLAKL